MTKMAAPTESRMYTLKPYSDSFINVQLPENVYKLKSYHERTSLNETVRVLVKLNIQKSHETGAMGVCICICIYL